MDYDAGGYRILVSGPETNFWATAHKSLVDVRLEVDAAKLGGPDENRLGLLCRQTGDEYYFFLITSDGYFGVGVFVGGAATLLGSPQMEFSDQILTGMAVNHLRADCSGQNLSLYVNGRHLVTVTDDRLAAGDVGLIAGTFASPGADIIFDNFQVLVP